MAVYEVSYKVITTSQEFRNLGRLSCMLLQVKKNARTIIITKHCPKVSASGEGAYSQKLEYVAIKKIKNDPRTQYWIDINTYKLKGIHQGKQKHPYGGLEYWSIGGKHIDGNKGTHQYNMRSKRVLRCSNHLSTIENISPSTAFTVQLLLLKIG